MAENSIDLKNFTLQKTEKSHCRHCKSPVFLLGPRSLSDKKDRFFYLCAECGAVAEAGVGEIGPPEADRFHS